MALIEFRCNNCKTQFEELIFHKGDIEEVICPHCNTAACKRLVSTFGFRSSSFADSTGTSCTQCSRTSCKGCASSKGEL